MRSRPRATRDGGGRREGCACGARERPRPDRARSPAARRRRPRRAARGACAAADRGRDRGLGARAHGGPYRRPRGRRRRLRHEALPPARAAGAHPRRARAYGAGPRGAGATSRQRRRSRSISPRARRGSAARRSISRASSSTCWPTSCVTPAASYRAPNCSSACGATTRRAAPWTSTPKACARSSAGSGRVSSPSPASATAGIPRRGGVPPPPATHPWRAHGE